MRSLLIPCAFAALLAPGVVRADIAPPTPSSLRCPRGSVGRVHTGEGRGFTTSCEPTTCATDADCADARVCSADEIGLCVERVVSSGGDPVPSARERGCEPDGACLNVNSACETSRRCVDADDRGEAEEPVEEPAEEDRAPSTQREPSGCGCRVGARGPAPVWMLGLLALVWVRRA